MAGGGPRLGAGDHFAGHRIESLVGQGAMGAVYAARPLDRPDAPAVAIKVLTPGALSTEEMKLRFDREAHVTRRLDSPFVVRTYAAGTADDGRPYLVMELLDGHELAHHLQTEEIDAATGLRLVAEIASVLDAAHAVGIVHRDLKPENVFLVAGEDGQKHVKVLDFGIAKVMDSKTITHGILGTPLYISPEQIHGQVRTTPKSDIYALGMLAFTIFVGTAYWSVEHEESLYAFLSSVVAGPSVSACARAADEHDVILPPAFDAWFLEATATDPEARYPSASALARGLAEALRLPRPDVGATTW